MNDDELHASLERLGASTPPAIDPVVEARIEHRLRMLHDEQRAPKPATFPIIVGVAAALLLGIALIASTTTTAPVDTTGVADGAGVPTSDPTDPGPSTSEPLDEDPEAAGADEEPSTGEDTPDLPSPPDDSSPVPDAPPASPTSAPATTVDRATTTSSTPTTAVESPRQRPARLRAAVFERGGRAVVEWDDPVRDVVAWTIVRSVGDRAGQRILRTTDPTVRRHVDDPPAEGRVTYVVRGHQRDGAVAVQSDPLVLDR